MADDMQSTPRPGTNADVIRRVERLEDGFNALSKSVDNVNHRLDMVHQSQTDQSEMMNVKFSSLEALGHSTQTELKHISDMWQAALNGTMEPSPAYKSIMEEYERFKSDTRSAIAEARGKDDKFEDYMLDQRARSEERSRIAARTFGSSLLGAIGAVIAIILGVIALTHPQF